MKGTNKHREPVVMVLRNHISLEGVGIGFENALLQALPPPPLSFSLFPLL